MTSITKSLMGRAAQSINRRVQKAAISRHLRKRNLGTANDIPTFTKPEELEALFMLAERCGVNARALEIGSYLGASTCYIVAGLSGPAAKVVCIDTWQNETMPDGERDTLSIFQKNLGPVLDHISIIRKASDTVSPADVPGEFELIFIDGDHTYGHVKNDFVLASRLLSSNGTLAFHDALFFEGVSKVLGEALASGKWQFEGSVRNLIWLRRANFNK
ncbi:MAG: class I SAM-dependent methyltransferase [Opitutus sp.]